MDTVDGSVGQVEGVHVAHLDHDLDAFREVCCCLGDGAGVAIDAQHPAVVADRCREGPQVGTGPASQVEDGCALFDSQLVDNQRLVLLSELGARQSTQVVRWALGLQVDPHRPSLTHSTGAWRGIASPSARNLHLSGPGWGRWRDIPEL